MLVDFIDFIVIPCRPLTVGSDRPTARSFIFVWGTCFALRLDGALCNGRRLSPCSGTDMVGTAVAAGKIGTLTAALTKAKLVDALKDDGPFTVTRTNG